MKKIILIAIAIFCSATLNAQTIQPGQVKEYRGAKNKTPLQGVEMLVKNASSTISDKKGKFLLEFHTLTPGDKVNVRRIEKLGYEIFNKEALEQWNINPKEPFIVVMVRSEMVKELRDKYSRLSSQSYDEQYKKDKANLEEERRAGRLTEEELKKQLIQLREDYDKQLDNIDNYVERFIHIDLSLLSKNEQEIISLIQAGKIDEAIKRYEELNLVEKYESLVKETNEIEDALNALNKKLSQNDNAINELVEQIKRQIDTYMLQGGQANYAKTLAIVERIANSTTDAVIKLNFVYCLKGKDAVRLYDSCDMSEIKDLYKQTNARLGYAISLFMAQRVEEAQIQAEKVIALAEEIDNLDFLIAAKNLMATIHVDKFDNETAAKIYDELLNLIENPDNDNELSITDKANIYESIGGFYQNIDVMLFLKYIEKSYLLSKQLYETAPTIRREYHYLSVMLEYGIALSVVQKTDESINILQELNAHIKECNSIYSIILYEIYFVSYKTLGENYFYKQDYINSERMFINAIEASSKGLKYNHEEDLIGLYNNLGYLYYTTGEYEKSEQAYLKSLEYATLLFYDSPNNFYAINSIFRPQINMCMLYVATLKYDLAKQYGYKGLNNCELLYNYYPQVFITEYLLILKHLAIAEFKSNQNTEALSLIDKAIAANPQDTESYDIKGQILHSNGDIDGAKVLLQKVIELEPTYFETHTSDLKKLLEETIN